MGEWVEVWRNKLVFQSDGTWLYKPLLAREDPKSFPPAQGIPPHRRFRLAVMPLRDHPGTLVHVLMWAAHRDSPVQQELGIQDLVWQDGGSMTSEFEVTDEDGKDYNSLGLVVKSRHPIEETLAVLSRWMKRSPADERQGFI